MKKQIKLIILVVALAAFSVQGFGQKTVRVRFAKGKSSIEIKSTGSNTFLVGIKKGQKFNAIAINESNCDSKMSGLMDVVDKNGVPGEEEAGYGAFSNNFKGTADVTGTYRFKITAAKCASYRFFISIE